MKKIHLKNLQAVEVYILLEQKFREQLFNKLFSKYKRKEDAAIALGVREGYSLTRYQKGIRFCPLSLLMKICKIINFDINKLEDKILEIKQGSSGKTGMANGIKNPKFPYKETKELAYLIAKFIGDGSITINKNRALQISYHNNDKILRKEIKNYAKSYFGNIFVREANRDVTFPSIVGYILLNFCPNFGTFDSKVPNFIMKNIEFNKSFLRAIFEDEGCIYYKKDRRMLIIGMSNQKVITQIWKMLEKIDIEPNPIRKSKMAKSFFYSFTISGRENLIKFQKEIGFSEGYYKKKKLANAINSYKFYQNRIGETKETILDYLKKENKSCSTKKLCKQLSIKRMNMLYHLRILENEGKVKRSIKKPLQDKKGRLLGNFSNEWIIVGQKT